MDWNTKWSWENVVSSSGSELAPGSSLKSSVSVCTDSSFRDVMKNSQVAFGKVNVFTGDVSEKGALCGAKHDQSPPPLESSVGSGESLIGLKLGKRMYFENNGFGSSSKTASVPEAPASTVASSVKKIKSSDQNTPRCQVEGCNLDLSSAKGYHRKHKVCASHSKCPKVVIGGLERRFCQQCSRFHSLSEFDEKKRSCRRRLSDHNARRRKPQLDPMQFSLPSPFSAFTYSDGRPQMSFVSSKIAHICSRSSSEATWESSYNSKITTTKGCMLNFGNTGGLDEQLQLAGTQLSHATNELCFDRLLPSKGTKSETLTRGFKESVLPPNLDTAPDLHRALSLLSNDTWSSFPPPNNSLDHSISVNQMHHQPLMQGFPESFPQTSSEFCQTGHHSTDSLAATANDAGHFQPYKVPYENVLFSNLLN